MSIGIYPIFTPPPVAPPTPPRDWSKVNIVAPLYSVMLRHRLNLKQLYFFMFGTHRISGKVGKYKSSILNSYNKIRPKPDRETWTKLKEWLEENM